MGRLNVGLAGGADRHAGAARVLHGEEFFDVSATADGDEQVGSVQGDAQGCGTEFDQGQTLPSLEFHSTP
ncbi:hypothetical protein GCM10010842_37070 [Deinococcus daejeonensis]|uniref:Uncharacterized protein n=1 Tax=Deinococcus daejeonensis TaxID=1007098 RepID=A0ABQ2JHE0_9DEIO|nr:hypothetical protein GCM10010842_37070 [Deinococcus daejeonensis]